MWAEVEASRLVPWARILHTPHGTSTPLVRIVVRVEVVAGDEEYVWLHFEGGGRSDVKRDAIVWARLPEAP